MKGHAFLNHLDRVGMGIPYGLDCVLCEDSDVGASNDGWRGIILICWIVIVTLSIGVV